MGYQNGFCHKADCFKEINSLIFHSPQLKEMSLQSAFYLLAAGGKDVTYLIVAQPTKAIPSNKNVHPVLKAGKKKKNISHLRRKKSAYYNNNKKNPAASFLDQVIWSTETASYLDVTWRIFCSILTDFFINHCFVMTCTCEKWYLTKYTRGKSSWKKSSWKT